MAKTLQGHFAPCYQSSDDLHTRRLEFKTLVCETARGLRSWCRTERERQRCDSVIRGASLSYEGLELLCTLAARSEQPWRLAQTIDGAVLQRAVAPAPICAIEASELEEASNGPLNEAQLLFAKEKTPVRAKQVIEAAMPQEQRTRKLIEAAHRFIGRAS